jgi:hypothetical protein
VSCGGEIAGDQICRLVPSAPIVCKEHWAASLVKADSPTIRRRDAVNLNRGYVDWRARRGQDHGRRIPCEAVPVQYRRARPRSPPMSAIHEGNGIQSKPAKCGEFCLRWPIVCSITCSANDHRNGASPTQRERRMRNEAYCPPVLIVARIKGDGLECHVGINPSEWMDAEKSTSAGRLPHRPKSGWTSCSCSPSLRSTPHEHGS